jgi:hypothetical protein
MHFASGDDQSQLLGIPEHCIDGIYQASFEQHTDWVSGRELFNLLDMDSGTLRIHIQTAVSQI